MTNGVDNLAGYLEDVGSKKFSVGRHDCLTFVNGAVKSVTGDGFADDWLGAYAGVSRQELIEKTGFNSVVEAIDSRLRRKSMQPSRGDIVGRKAKGKYGVALGVCVGSRAVFIGKNKLVALDIDTVQYVWGIDTCHK